MTGEYENIELVRTIPTGVEHAFELVCVKISLSYTRALQSSAERARVTQLDHVSHTC